MGKATSWLTSYILFLIHLTYALVNAATSLYKLYTTRDPRPLTTKRRQLPSHLAILFACDDDDALDRFEGELLANIEQIVTWCRLVGIKRLTVYDRRGVLSRSIFTLRARLQPEAVEDDYCTSESEDIEYPLTPPLSDDAGSRPLTPQSEVLEIPPKLHVTTLQLLHTDRWLESSKRRRSSKSLTRRHLHVERDSDTQEAYFSVHVISRESGKTALANAATLLGRRHQGSQHSASDEFTISQNEMNSILEGKYGFPSPDLMLVHNVLPHKVSKNVLELHGFPPWQIRLTEFHYNKYPSSAWARWRLLWKPPYIPLDEKEFRHALDEYADAEMRRGK